jgi:hypothetical protein
MEESKSPSDIGAVTEECESCSPSSSKSLELIRTNQSLLPAGDRSNELENSSNARLADDPFSPLEGIPDDNEQILTFRAIAVGVMCGALVNASNVYLGLKSGWTTSANLSAVRSYCLLWLADIDVCVNSQQRAINSSQF